MQATCITVFVFSSIFLSSLAIAFARPWNGEQPKMLQSFHSFIIFQTALYLIFQMLVLQKRLKLLLFLLPQMERSFLGIMSGKEGHCIQCMKLIFFRLPIFINPVLYDLELRPNLTSLEVQGIIKLDFKVKCLFYF